MICGSLSLVGGRLSFSKNNICATRLELDYSFFMSDFQGGGGGVSTLIYDGGRERLSHEMHPK